MSARQFFFLFLFLLVALVTMAFCLWISKLCFECGVEDRGKNKKQKTKKQKEKKLQNCSLLLFLFALKMTA